MPRTCASCTSEHATEINRKLKSGSTNADVSRWLTEVGDPITEHAIGRHAKAHLGVTPHHGRRPLSDNFLEAVVEDAHDQLKEGTLRASLRDAISAQKVLDERLNRNADRDLIVKIGLVLTGQIARPLPPPSEEIEALEAEFRPLLEAGD